MKIRIDGRELLVKKTTRTLVEFQRQSGIDLSKWDSGDAAVYGNAFAAFCALHNAGFQPNWEELLDRDLDEIEIVEEPGDTRTAEADAPEPMRSRQASDPGAASPVEEWPPPSED